MSTQQLVEQVRKDADDVVRYCPECGTIGPLPDARQACCPDSFGMSVLRWQAEKMERMLERLRRAAELERLERKPLTQSAVELAFKESLATHYYDFVDGVRFAERAHHIGEGEEK